MIRTTTITWQTRGSVLALAFLVAAALAVVGAGLAHAAPAAFTVINTNNAGPGSLRQAISDANANNNSSDVDTIDFAIPAETDPGCDAASGVCTISPDDSVLPRITEPVTIDGYSQPGASPNTQAEGSNAALKVELSGANAIDNADGITISTEDSVVKGLVINRWDGKGILIAGSDNRVEGNFIGTDASGTADLGNSGDGIDVIGASGNVVGGTAAGARNVISGNDLNGVAVTGGGASGNRILRNSISDNGRLGIELDVDDVTANDPGDADTGPNNLQNYPVLTSVATSGEETTIQGTLNSSPNDTFNLQFFSGPVPDSSGFGEGETFVGQTNVTANAGGNVTFSFTTAAPVEAGRVVTATATNTATGDTSKFSEAVEVEDNTPPTPEPQCSDGVDNDGDTLIDFPSDPDCGSDADDSESPDPPRLHHLRHPRRRYLDRHFRQRHHLRPRRQRHRGRWGRERHHKGRRWPRHHQRGFRLRHARRRRRQRHRTRRGRQRQPRGCIR